MDAPASRHAMRPARPLASTRRALLALMVMGVINILPAQQEPTPSPQECFLEIRTDAILSMDKDFLRQEGLSEENTRLFLRTRLSAEDQALAHARKTNSHLTMGALARETDAALTRAFDADFAQRYRLSADTQLGWFVLNNTPSLKSADWLTPEEKERLAGAWGPIIAEVMDVSLQPNFESATTKEQKQALAERLKGDYLKRAGDILDPSKLAKLESALTDL